MVREDDLHPPITVLQGGNVTENSYDYIVVTIEVKRINKVLTKTGLTFVVCPINHFSSTKISRNLNGQLIL